MGKYDMVIITNLPAFYKINLFNEINKQKKIYVVFTGANANQRNADFFSGQMSFDYDFMTRQNIWNIIKTIFKIRKNINDELIIGGWDHPIMFLATLLSTINSNSIIVESCIYESKTKGLKYLAKKFLLRRISKAYVPGEYNAELLKALNFKGKIIETRGVGIFNYHRQPLFQECSSLCNRFLYVGRLSPEKNLLRLLEVMERHLDWTLDIVGFGPQDAELRNIAGRNVHFLGAIDNNKLTEVYQSHDIFVLPSISETWGLVVEEALNNGLPVAISERAGCVGTWLKDDKYGLTFNPFDIDNIERTLLQMTRQDFNNKCRYNISKLDFDKIEKNQINCYL